MRPEELERMRKKFLDDANGAAGGLVTIRASDVKIQNIDFIWPGRLARGKHTMFAGEGGLGKSQMFIDITARITNGDFWPCGHDRAPVGHVVILSAEDTVADVLVPRLMAAGAKLERVTIIKSVKLDNGKGERKFSLQNDLGALKNTIAEINASGDIKVALVWIDPVSSYMGAVDSHNNTALRSVLDPITDAADASSVAFASITHFNKGGSDKGIKAVHRVMGSAAFTNAPRAAFAVIKDPDDEDRTLVLHLKTNIGSKQPGLAFRFADRKVSGKAVLLKLAPKRTPEEREL
jgi:RecA-family ATPase